MLIGAHLDNVDVPSDASYARLKAMRAQVVGTLWTDGTHHRRPVYDRLEQLLGKPTYSVRVGPSARLSPRAWAKLANEALAEVPPAAVDEGRVRVRCLNEVNLPAEGGWAPDDYAAFLRAARRLARLPSNVPLVASPLSLGLPDWRDWWQRFVAAAGGPIPADRIAVNCYAHLVAEAAFFADYGRPVDVTEINTLTVPRGPARADWLRQRFRDLEAVGVESAQVFIAGGKSYGAWDENYILTDEEAADLCHSEERSDEESRPSRNNEAPVDVDTVEIPRSARNDTDAAPDHSSSTSTLAAQPMAGHGMWIWYVANAEGGDPAAIAARARSAGVRYVLVKCGDGAQSWSQFTPELVAALKSEGVETHGWAYCYGDDVDGELAVAERCLAAGADGYVADVEAEYEGRWREAERFAAGLADLRARFPNTLIGYSPLPVIDYHQSLPYAQLNRVADVVLPQFYCRALGAQWTMDALWEQWRRWSGLWQGWDVPVPRIVPVGEAFGAATGDDLRAQAEPDMSFWEWGQARDEHWSALAALPLPVGEGWGEGPLQHPQPGEAAPVPA